MIEEYEVKISLDRWRGCHDSRPDFPPNPAHPSQHPTDCCTDIVLAFANKTYIMPGMILHYIDDVASIGWSWVPPQHFINCLTLGYDPEYKGARDFKHPVGYLTKKENSPTIYDGDSEAQTSPQVVIDDDVLALLKRIVAYVEANDERLDENSKESFSSKPARRNSMGKK